MTTKRKVSVPLRAIVAGLAVFGAGQSMAQVVTGQLTDTAGSGSGYAAYIQNLTFSGGSTAYGGAGVVVCIDPFNAFPDPLPSTHSYDVVGAGAVISAAPAYAGRTEALIDWVIDRYYAGFLNGSISSYGFNQVLWELTTDYTGTLASLSTTGGDIYGTRPEYLSMMTGLKNSYASISDSYRSIAYTTTFLVDRATDNQYQNMVLVTAVPEPSTYLMMFAGVGALMAWRRRSGSR